MKWHSAKLFRRLLSALSIENTSWSYHIVTYLVPLNYNYTAALWAALTILQIVTVTAP